MKFLLAVILLSIQLSVYAGFGFGNYVSEKWAKITGDTDKEEKIADILVYSNEYVSEKWDDLCEVMGEVSTLRDELPSLPKSSLFGKDQEGQKEKIQKILKEAEEILLPEQSQEQLKRYKKFDKKINKIQKEINELIEDSVVNPKNSKKNDKKITEFKEEIKSLEKQQIVEKKKILGELNKLGLNIPEENLEPFFASVTCESLIEYTILSANITIVVKKLEELIQKNLEGAKKYYGMYLVMVDLQILCHEEFISKCDNVWIKRIDALKEKILKDYKESIGLSENLQFSEDERLSFSQNAKLNKTTLDATTSYRKCIEDQRAKLSHRLYQINRMRKVASNTYQTIDNAVNLKSIMSENVRDFNSVITLEFPDMKIMSEDILINEFRSITEKIQ